MTLREAYALLDSAPYGNIPSALNPNITQAQAVKIVRDGVASLGQPRGKPCGLDDKIDPLAEKRVHQVSMNQKRPRF